jgi:sugar O-acyltransferase (sialic acid O-acetyltransferase NeuD family)
MNNIVIIGAGGFGREVAWLIEEINEKKEEWNLLGFLDDNPKLTGMQINGYPVLGNVDWLRKRRMNVVCALGDPQLRKRIITNLEDSDNEYPVLIHPSVIKSKLVEFGPGTIVCAGTIITTNVRFGKHVLINLDCTIGHDACIGNYTTIFPSVNISGNVVMNNV